MHPQRIKNAILSPALLGVPRPKNPVNPANPTWIKSGDFVFHRCIFAARSGVFQEISETQELPLCLPRNPRSATGLDTSPQGKLKFHEAENTKFGNSQTEDLHSAKPEAATESPARF